MPKKKKKQVVSLDNFDTTPMSKDELVKLCIRLQEETKREKSERNFFMMERDKLRAFWEVTRKQLDDLRAELRDKEHRLDDDDMMRLSEIKHHEQKILHTMLEFQKSLAEFKVGNMEVLHKAQQDNWEESQALRKDCEVTSELLEEMDDSLKFSMQDTKLLHSSHVSYMRDEHALCVLDLSGAYERLVTALRHDTDEKNSKEKALMMKRHKGQIEKLVKNNAQALTDLRNYYNEITLNNLSLVASLKAECGDLREREDRAIQLKRSLRAENKMLAGPLRAVRKELAYLKRKMANLERDKAELEVATEDALAAEDSLRDTQWEKYVTEILLDKVREDRDECAERLKMAQAELQLRRAKRQIREERRVRDLRATVEQRNAEAAAGEMDVSDCRRLEAVQPLMDEKNKRITALSLEVVRLRKAHATTMQLLHGALRDIEADVDDGLRVVSSPVLSLEDEPRQ